MKALTQLAVVLAAFTALSVTAPAIGKRRLADVTVSETVSVAWRIFAAYELYKFVREHINAPR